MYLRMQAHPQDDGLNAATLASLEANVLREHQQVRGDAVVGHSLPVRQHPKYDVGYTVLRLHAFHMHMYRLLPRKACNISFVA